MRPRPSPRVGHPAFRRRASVALVLGFLTAIASVAGIAAGDAATVDGEHALASRRAVLDEVVRLRSALDQCRAVDVELVGGALEEGRAADLRSRWLEIESVLRVEMRKLDLAPALVSGRLQGWSDLLGDHESCVLGAAAEPGGAEPAALERVCAQHDELDARASALENTARGAVESAGHSLSSTQAAFDTASAALAALAIALALLAWIWRARARRIENEAGALANEPSYPATPRVVLAWSVPLVLAGGVGMTSLFAWHLAGQAEKSDRDRFELLSDRVREEIVQRIAALGHALQSSGALWPASATVERAEFAAMVRGHDLAHRFRGALGMGFARRVGRGEVDAFVERTRLDGAPNFEIRTTSSAADLFVVEFIEPLGTNHEWEGRDLGADPVLRAAAERAMRTGEACISEPMPLPRAKGEGAGLVLLYPVYARDARIATEHERVAALEGWTFMPIITSRAVQGVRDVVGRELAFDLYHGATDRLRAPILSAADDFAASIEPQEGVEHAALQCLQVAGQPWTLVTRTTDDFTSTSRASIAAIAVAGVALALLAAGLLWSMIRVTDRAHALAERMTSGLRVAQAEAERLALVARHTTNAVLITDAQGRITWVNEGFLRLSGYALEEVIGRIFDGFLRGEHADGGALGAMREAWRSGRSFHGEIESRTKDGRELWVDIDVQPVRGASGDLAGFIAIQSDVTERVRAREELHGAKRAADAALREVGEWRRALDQHAIISVTDAAGRITAVNGGFVAISGFERCELLGKNHRVVNSGVHPREFWSEMWAAISKGNSWRGEVCNRRKDGALYWVDSTIVPFLGDDGRIEKFVSIRFDVTARNAAQAEIRRSERFLGETLAVLDAHIAILDRSGTIRLVNDAWRRFSRENGGSEEAVCEGVNYFEVCARSDGTDAILLETVAAIRAVLAGDAPPVHIEYPCHSRQHRRWFQVSVRRVEVLAEVYACVAHQDVTHLRETVELLSAARTQAEASNRAKSEFLANMSHEIRTPMTAILGFTELLLEEGGQALTPERRREAATTIRRNGEHLLSIINDILDLSKIEAGKLVPQRAPTRVDRVVAEVVELMSVKAEAKRIELRAEIDPAMPEEVGCDPLRLRQILVNLVGNAIKFTETGSVRIRVRYDHEHGIASFAVEDTGIGLTEEQMQRVFGAFEQADASMSRRFGGTGLGLRISQRLTQLLGGELTVTSRLGQGSTFTATVVAHACVRPMLASPTPLDALAAVPAPFPSSGKALHGLRVLLAEDGRDNARLITLHLGRAGATVTAVENGKLAIERLTTDGTLDGPLASPAPFDVLVTDMQMPELDGYESVRILRAKGCELPIVALTAHAMSDDRERCRQVGCDEYATKPVDRTQLVEACLRAVATRKSGQLLA